MNPGYKPTIVFDVDGVLLDFFKSFMKWCVDNQKDTAKGYTIYQSNTTPPDFSLDELVRGDPIQLINEFAESQQYAHLRGICAPTSLDMLKMMGYRLIAITAAPETPLARRSRLMNLAMWYGGIFEEVHFTGDCKFNYLEETLRIKPAFFIEDKPSTLMIGNNQGYNMIGIVHNYNKHLIDTTNIVMASDTDWACAYIAEHTPGDLASFQTGPDRTLMEEVYL